MSTAAKELLSAVLALSAEERAEIAEQLLQSLDDTRDPGWKEAWQGKISRRLEEIDRGR